MPDSLDLLFIDPKSAARIRKRPAWQSLVADARRGGVRPDADAPPVNDDVSAEDRTDVFVIVARGPTADSAGVARAIEEAVRSDGKFAPPLVLVAGELTLPFDELSALKATVTTATPFAGGDEALESSLAAAKDFLQTPGLLAPPAVVEALTGRIRDAFRRTRRAVPADYLETQSERALTEQRCHQKRMFQGAPHLRALLASPGDRASMLVYLPASVTDALPLSNRFGARLVAEAYPASDQLESHAFSLRVLCLARSIPQPRK